MEQTGGLKRGGEGTGWEKRAPKYLAGAGIKLAAGCEYNTFFQVESLVTQKTNL